ncbi:hypothetical protein CSB45_10910 [candidate division KSB3 bacterium]|uniref:Glycosyl transferase family 1 domain-containing protein n=1 Tax=candidate division KSB3 bacterium TaxID=2044937 RepID=A0A2G6E391_9BACT|nr:MAG: hypothetical protein CSB45_10910 [candidate division KSB3 bacterium]PIE29079.1 MAG: hypothetical protein CSA57_10695 [candidate division KSB3 bacterium]
MKNRSLKIAIMARSLGMRNGGVYRYVYNLLSELDRRAEADGLDIYILHNEQALQKQFPHSRKIYLYGNHSYCYRLLFDYVYSLFYLARLRVDVALYPKNIIPFTHMLLRAHKINTILDLGHFDKELRAYRFWDTLYAKAFMKFSCRLAWKTVAISHNTKRDLIQILQIPSEKIEVIHLGIEEKFRKETRNHAVLKKYHVQVPFLFYNGSISPRKNMMRVLQAFGQLQENIPHTLYITGSLTWGAEAIYAYIEQHLRERVKIVGFLEEEELIAFYGAADLFLYPSLFEGFGLPILEAQSCGCPVLTSNTTACPEVAGAGAHLVDPYSIEEIRAGIIKILKEEGYRQQLVEKGFHNTRRFGWDNTTDAFVKLCQSLKSE